MDILPTDMIENFLLQFDDHNDKPINSYFELLGYNHKNSLRNMGSAALYLIFSVFLLIFVLFIDSLMYLLKIQTKKNCLTKIHNWARGQLLWNFYIRLIMSQYLSFALSSMINLEDVRIMKVMSSISYFQYS
jgi:hypothetical protein